VADRREQVSVRLNGAEAAALTAAARAAHLPVTTYVRRSALGHRITAVPAVNLEAWRDLARTLGLLNQAVAAIHVGKVPADLRPVLDAVAAQVRRLRLDLNGNAADEEDDA
jgi:hypothetical protein